MKKTLAVILCVCMMLALFAGCGESASTQQPAAAQTEAPAEPADENALPEQYDLIMTFGAETGSVYAMGIQIGEYINSIAPDITCTVKVGAAASNLALLSTGEPVIADSQSVTFSRLPFMCKTRHRHLRRRFRYGICSPRRSPRGCSHKLLQGYR